MTHPPKVRSLLFVTLVGILGFGCNAFVDETEVGPPDEEPLNNVAPNNTAVNNGAVNNGSPNNVAPNNIIANIGLNNLTECVTEQECATCDGNTALECEPNPDVPGCYFITSSTTCTESCVDGRCVVDACEPECSPDDYPVCSTQGILECILDSTGCPESVTYECPEMCAGDPLSVYCDLTGKPCEIDGDRKCHDATQFVQCGADLFWAEPEPCGAEKYCSPVSGECVSADEL